MNFVLSTDQIKIFIIILDIGQWLSNHKVIIITGSKYALILIQKSFGKYPHTISLLRTNQNIWKMLIYTESKYSPYTACLRWFSDSHVSMRFNFVIKEFHCRYWNTRMHSACIDYGGWTQNENTLNNSINACRSFLPNACTIIMIIII